MTTLTTLPLDQIYAHPRNVRRTVGDVDELAASIKGVGILQPLTVAPQDGRYILIAGHRRLAGAQAAGLTEVPCVVREDLTDDLAAQLAAQLVENLQRSDLTVMEEADAYAQLELLGVKEAAIAKTTGRSRATVHQRILLTSLPAERREQYEKGSLSLDGAVTCARLRQQYADDAEILAMVDEAGTWAFSGGYGVEGSIKRLLEERKRADEPQSEPEEDVDTLDLAGKRAEREAEWAERDRERNERIDAHKAARERMYDWLSGRIATRDEVVAERLINLAIDFAAQGDGLDRVLPLLGIDPAGEDEDVDDAILRITLEAKALTTFDKTLLLALVLSEMTSEYAYLPDHAREMTDLGYALTDDDKALLAPATDEDEDDDQEDDS